MRIEKTQNVDQTTKVNANARPANTQDSNVPAERADVRGPAGDIAALTRELKSPRYDINRQALLQQVKKKLAHGDYHSQDAAEATASAILRYLDMKIPRD